MSLIVSEAMQGWQNTEIGASAHSDLMSSTLRSAPSGSPQSKWYRRFASVSSMVVVAIRE